MNYPAKHMKIFTIAAFFVSFGCKSFADSGGPYDGVPDLKESQGPPIFQIPESKRPLRYYLQNMPTLRWNRQLGEPDSYTWNKIDGYHASFRMLGHVRGRELFEIRYVSDSRVDQGLDFADAILILARGFDTGKDNELFEAVYYSSGGTSYYDRRAEYVREGDKYGAVKITGWWSGTGPGRSRNVYLRGTEDFAYERFTPDQTKAGQGGAGQPATAPESKAESDHP